MKPKQASQARSVLEAAAFLLLVIGNPVQIQAAEIRASRVLHLARPNDPKTLDLAGTYLSADFILLALLNRPLLEVVNGTELINCAASTWSRSADARSYTFHLRPELRFSNGRPVVAADYAYALERIVDPRTTSPMAIYLISKRDQRSESLC
ncbi:MAG: ABC transporter substrate-binding protein [Verrucomicrobiia bacterium]